MNADPSVVNRQSLLFNSLISVMLWLIVVQCMAATRVKWFVNFIYAVFVHLRLKVKANAHLVLCVFQKSPIANVIELNFCMLDQFQQKFMLVTCYS